MFLAGILPDDVGDVKDVGDVVDIKEFGDAVDVSNATMSWRSAMSLMRRCLAWSCLILQ